MFLDTIKQQSTKTIWIYIAIMTTTLGVVDYLTGFEISFAFFYLLPVSLAAWTINRRAGYLTAFICAATWQLVNSLAGEQLSSWLIQAWNTSTRIGFFMVVSWLLSTLHELLNRESNLARIDYLTGLLNRRAFYEITSTELQRISRYLRPISIIYIDLDNFKNINDRLGHAAGDAVLKAVGLLFSQLMRTIDKAARLGGDEFAILLPETDAEAAKSFSLRLQNGLNATMGKNDWDITFSIGVVTCLNPVDDVGDLISMADQLMYKVKRSGKNSIYYSIFST